MATQSRTFRMIVAVVVAASTACASGMKLTEAQIGSYLSSKPNVLHKAYRRLLTEGPQDRVLNNMRVGVTALQAGELREASGAFDQALSGIETVYANNKQAERARSLWRNEGSKDFKGEPYERAMAYYYRGLLYLHEGDYENARASFKGGQLQDTLAENQRYAGDFALLNYLEGWASQCNLDARLADSAFDEAERVRPGLQRPASGHNVLIVTETGKSPQKFASGKGDSELRFRPGKGFSDYDARIDLDGNPVNVSLTEDVYFQASTRGSRPIDKILEGQAHFQQTTKGTGQVLTHGGLGFAQILANEGFNDAALIGLGVATVGLVVQLVSDFIKPEADIRYWESLPNRVHVATAYASPAMASSLQVQFEGKYDNPIPSLHRGGKLSMGPDRCAVVWVPSGTATGSLTAARPLGLTVAGAF